MTPRLADLIQSVSSRTSQAQTLVSGWIAELNRIGLDTSQLSRAAQDLAWAQEQIPMLKRRQELIIAASQQGGSPGLAVAAAGDLAFPTDAAAAKAGTAAGSKARQALDDSENADFIALDLAQNAGDPAYLAAFFQALGPQELTRLGLYLNTLPAAQRQA
ncbi:MAG: hypothetical protein JOY82_19035 [Streptosporangiaceae bacterium]|nr:hypothetical protein [Streptosporangiaceae bacterium]MBV9856580.1 hypothetical protein [Streptosporangiaceae bacterium]